KNQAWMRSSDDNGRTWSAARDITRSARDYDNWSAMFLGPGVSVCHFIMVCLPQSQYSIPTVALAMENVPERFASTSACLSTRVRALPLVPFAAVTLRRGTRRPANPESLGEW